ncbi:MAG: thioredoxin family protein [Deltaproteobacteria bacterium]|nr:thioredoxin family protein [Deltaproteobacteria bacterium]
MDLKIETMINKNRYADYLMLFVFIPIVLLAPQYVVASEMDATDGEIVNIRTAWSTNHARPGDSIFLAIVADIKAGFHINADKRQVNPLKNFKPYPTKLAVIDADERMTIEAPRYPKAIPINVQYAYGELMSFEGQAIIYLPIKVEENITPGLADLRLEFEYQACAANYCLFPKKIRLDENLKVVPAGTPIEKINKDLFAAFDAEPMAATARGVAFNVFGWSFSIDASSGVGLVLLLITAAFGGLLLNFTPCVLPLIPIKIISLSHVADNRKQCLSLGLAMFLGILAFWLVLGVMIALVSEFSATNQLFQYPAFTILVGFIIGVMATGMFGFFSVRLPNFIYVISPKQNTLHGSFGLGILAAILSTPCTAPFMGAAAAWASTQTPATTLATFTAIGTGMALPYLVLSISPSLVDKMPRSGPAGVLIKQVMGLFMLATAAYFIGVGSVSLFSSPPNPTSKIFWWPVMILCTVAGAWLIFRTLQIASKPKMRVFFSCLGLIVVALSIWGGARLTDKGPIDWAYYTPQRFEKATSDRKVIVMVFTAEWCLNCKVLEQGVLTDPKIVNLFDQEDIVPMKVDITSKNPAGKTKLKQVGSLTIPLLVIFSPNGNQVFKSDFYTVEQLYTAITKILQNFE